MDALNKNLQGLNSMRNGGDYSTSEKWTGNYWIDGKKIYKKVVDLGALPSSGEASKNLQITNLNEIIKCSVSMKSGDIWMPIPYTDPTTTSATVGYYLNGSTMAIKVASNRSTYTGRAIVLYTCTDR